MQLGCYTVGPWQLQLLPEQTNIGTALSPLLTWTETKLEVSLNDMLVFSTVHMQRVT